jgi:hypothetical protein
VQNNALNKAKTIDQNFIDDELKLQVMQSSSVLHSHIFLPKLKEKVSSSTSINTEDNEVKYETLDHVKANLENIHLTLQNYCFKNSWDDILINNNQYNKIIDNLNEDNLYNIKNNCSHSYDYLHNSWNECNGETNPELSFDQIGTDKISKTTFKSNEKYSIFKDLNEETEYQEQREDSDIFVVAKQSVDCKEELDKSISEINVNIESYCTVKNDFNKDKTCLAKHSKLLKNNKTAINSSDSNLIKISKKNNSDNKSPDILLLKEGFESKNERLFRIGSKNDKSELQISKAEIQNKCNNYSKYENTEQYIQANALNMITEESSKSCSQDKRDKIPKPIKKYNNVFQKVENNNNSSQFEYNENTQLINKLDSEDKIFEYNVIMEQENINFQKDNSNQNSEMFDAKIFNKLLEFNEGKSVILPIPNLNSQKNNIFYTFEHVSGGKMDFSNKDDKENARQNNECLNLNYFTDSSSEVSVNKLIDQLIESERKYKFSKSLFKRNSKQNITVASLSDFINFHNVLESAQSESEDCDNFFTEFNKFQEEKLIDDNCSINNENEILSELCGIKDAKMFLDNTINSNNFNLQIFDTGHENNNSKRNLSGNITFDSKDDDNFDNLLRQYHSKQLSNSKVNDNNINNSKIKNDTKNNDDFKVVKHTDFKISDDDTISKDFEDPLVKVMNTNDKTKYKKINDSRDAGDFYNHNPYVRNFQPRGTFFNTEHYDVIKEIVKNNLHCGDSNSSIIASNNNHASQKTRNLKQNCFKVDKKYSSKILPKLSEKNSLGLSNSSKYIKAKSNLNLTSIEKINPKSTRRRSKSYIMAREISHNISNINSNKLNKESLSNLFKNLGTTEKFYNYNNKKLSVLTSKSFSQLFMPSSKVMLTDLDTKTKIKNSSFETSVPFNMPIDNSIENQSNINNKNKNSFEINLISSELPSKPYSLKSNNNLEDIINVDHDSCQRNPDIDDLITLFDSYTKKKEIKQKHESNNTNLTEENLPLLSDTCELQQSNNSNRNEIIYVNFITENGKITTKRLSLEQFIEYIRSRELKIKDVNQQYTDCTIDNGTYLMSLCKSQDMLKMPRVTKPWFLKIESKESEILVKPSTLDMSTSISDLSYTSDVIKISFKRCKLHSYFLNIFKFFIVYTVMLIIVGFFIIYLYHITLLFL